MRVAPGPVMLPRAPSPPTEGARWTHRPRAGLEPELVLPGQLDGRGVNAWLQPERSLMLAVLEEAISTFRKYAGADSRRGRRLFKEAQDWCLSDDTSWPFSFASICLELGIDPEWLRDGLRRWREARLQPTASPSIGGGSPSVLRRRASGSRTRATSLAGILQRTA